MIFVSFLFLIILLCLLARCCLPSNFIPILLICTQLVSYISKADSCVGIIAINNVTGLNMIGERESHPIDGHYNLTDSFDVSGLEKPISVFNGSINGNYHVLYNIATYLIKNLKDNGVFEKTTIYNANTTNTACGAAIADLVSDNAIIRFVKIEKGLFYGGNEVRYLGSIANKLTNNARIENVMVINAEMISFSNGYYPVVGEINYGTGKVGGVAGFVAGHSRLNNITVIDLKVSADEDKAYIGGVAGLMVGSSRCANMTVINIQLTAAGFEASAGGAVGSLLASDINKLGPVITDVTCINITIAMTKIFINSAVAVGGVGGDVGSAGGAMGRYEPINSRSGRITVISSNILSVSCIAGGVIGYTSGTYSRLSDIICINTTVEGRVAGGLFGDYRFYAPNFNTLMINSTAKGYDKGSIASAVIGFLHASALPNVVGTPSNVIVINSTAVGFSKYGVAACYGNWKRNDTDCLAEGVVFNHSKIINLTQIVVRYTGQNMEDKCSWVKLPFVSDDCLINKEEMEAYQQPDMWYNYYYCAMPQADSVSVNTILVTFVSVSSAMSISLFYYNWFIGNIE